MGTAASAAPSARQAEGRTQQREAVTDHSVRSRRRGGNARRGSSVASSMSPVAINRRLAVWSRYIGAAGVLAIGLDHLVELSADHYSAIPTIGPLFAANFAGAALIACGLVAPVERLPGLAGRAATPLLTLSGIGLAASSLAGLLVSERTALFGFRET